MIEEVITPDPRTEALDCIHTTMLSRKWKLVTAESLTCGLIASTLAERSGCSAYHRGAFVTYDIDMKVDMLGVNREIAERCNCVSEDIALQMAFGARKRTRCHVVLAVTGYAEPWPEGGIEDPFAYYAALCGMTSRQGRINLVGGDRNTAREKVVTTVLCVLADIFRWWFANH